MSGKRLDIIVHGATGYTGRLIAHYLAGAKSSSNVSWGISGRSRSKLDELAVACEKISAEKADGRSQTKPQIFVGDSLSKADMQIVAARAKVIIACAGPFSKYGILMVEACVEAGTHYVDITGEFPFVREMIEKFHDAAVAKGVMLMPCSGFDCVPFDLANACAHRIGQEAGLNLRRVETSFAGKSAGASRGTLESIMNIKNAMRKPDLTPLSLVPQTKRAGMLTPVVAFPKYHSGFGAWTGPFFMSGINERIVRRANATSPQASRAEATYVEMTRGSFMTVISSCMVYVFLGLLFVPGVGNLIRRFMFPEAGQGPSGSGFFKTVTLGYVSQSAPKPAVELQITADVEGYRFTAIAAAETALAIVADEVDEGVTGGVVTTGAALTSTLPQRLEGSGHVKFTPVRNGKPE